MSGVRARLGALAFAQWFVPGLFAAQIACAPVSSAAPLVAAAAAALLAAVFAGVFADRVVDARRAFSALHVAGALALATFAIVPPGDHISMPLVRAVALFVFALCNAGALALANGLAFRHLGDPDRHFGVVRMAGVAGLWAGVALAGWGAPGPSVVSWSGVTAAVLAAATGALAPATPPMRTRHSRDLGTRLGAGVLVYLSERSFALNAAVALAVSAAATFALATRWLTTGAASCAALLGALAAAAALQAVTLVSLGPVLVRVGVARALVAAQVGVAAGLVWQWAAGPGAGALPAGMLSAAGAVAAATVTQMYANRCAADAAKHAVQGLMVAVLYGAGPLAGVLAALAAARAGFAAQRAGLVTGAVLVAATVALVILAFAPRAPRTLPAAGAADTS